MTYEELKNKGQYIADDDRYNNGIYAGTNHYYVYDGDLYVRAEPRNDFSYNGVTETYKAIPEVVNELNSKTYAYFAQIISRDVYEQLCAKFGVEPSVI